MEVLCGTRNPKELFIMIVLLSIHNFDGHRVGRDCMIFPTTVLASSLGLDMRVFALVYTCLLVDAVILPVFCCIHCEDNDCDIVANESSDLS